MREQQVWLELARRFRNPIDGQVYRPEVDDACIYLCCHIDYMKIPNDVRVSMRQKIDAERRVRLADDRLDAGQYVVFGDSITERAEFCERMATKCDACAKEANLVSLFIDDVGTKMICPECWDKLDPDMWVPKEHWLSLTGACE